MKTYKVVRFAFNEGNRVIKTGLTLEEAQEHCNREDTHKKDPSGNVIWFDGYTVE